MRKILLSGVPGAGKTTIARHIESEFGFFHIDMEQDDFAPRREFRLDREAFMGSFAVHEDVLMSWGFEPFEDRASISYILERGFNLVWLDGNRVASFREFMKREENDPAKEADYYKQMQMIVVTGIIEKLNPSIINPFDERGEFRNIADIAEEIIHIIN